MKIAVEEANSRGVDTPERPRFRFERLTAWQSARRLCGEGYAATQLFPKQELFGLTGQIRRALVSIAANIAEGSGRNSDADFAHFLEIAHGSAMEVASLLYLASDAGYLDLPVRDGLLGLVAEVAAQTSALHRSLQVGHTKTPFPRKPRQ